VDPQSSHCRNRCGLETDAQSLAAEIGLIKAINDWDLQRIISFHSRVKRAKQFSQELRNVFEWLGEDHKPRKVIWCEHVSGDMPTISRRNKLKRLKKISEDEVGLLSNARCLSEGVDVPALDGVAFIDARRSEIDIVQAVGRAIRLSGNKKMGTIVIPVFIERHEDPEEAIKSSNFKPIWDVLDALKAHDDVVCSQLDQLRIELGAGTKSKVGEQDLSKIVFDLPTSVDANFAESLRVQLVAETTESWMFWYGLLQAFVKKHGHCRVFARRITADGYRLGSWVDKQRQRQGGMSAERKARFDALGFIWDRHEAVWGEGFEYLRAYASERGHCRVSFSYVTADGYRLGQWVDTQRIQEGRISPGRRARLDALGFIWDALTHKWEEGYQHLEAYVNEHGDCKVPLRYQCPDGFRLGVWVNKQRQKRNKLSPERTARLHALGFIWDRHEALWEEGFEYLKAYVSEHLNCKVPYGYRASDGYRLGQWVQVQRNKQDSLSAERKTRLDALGFVWDVLAEQWEVGFQHLAAFVREHGHCRVLATHVTADGFPLGQWVKVQRRRKDRISAERKARLDGVGFVWDTRASKRRAA
jgi:Helicase associated domain/Helicase conserved C-terminal domain